MSTGLDVVILDDDSANSKVLCLMVERFYTFGRVHAFTEFLEAKHFCLRSGADAAVFILDVFLDQGQTGFDFLDAVRVHYPMAAEDTVIVTGEASGEVVNKCLDAGVNHLLEKPIKMYALRFAVNAIAAKYGRFAQRLRQNPDFAKSAIRGLAQATQ